MRHHLLIALVLALWPALASAQPLTFRTEANCTGSGTTCTITLTGVTAGDLVVVGARERDGNSITGCSGSSSGAYTAHPNNSANSGIFYKIGASADGTVTCTWGATITLTAHAVAVVFNPNGATVTLDQTASATNTTTTSHSAGSITTTGSGVIVSQHQVDSNPTSMTGTSGFTGTTEATDRQLVQYKITTTGETTTSTITTGASVSGEGHNVSFRDGAGGGGGAGCPGLLLRGVCE